MHSPVLLRTGWPGNLWQPGAPAWAAALTPEQPEATQRATGPTN